MNSDLPPFLQGFTDELSAAPPLQASLVLKSEVTALEHAIPVGTGPPGSHPAAGPAGWAVLAPSPALTQISLGHYFWQIFSPILLFIISPLGN